MGEPIYRETRFEAHNGLIAEGQLPLEYGLRFEPADDLIVITENKDEQRIELTVDSFVELIREANVILGGGVLAARLGPLS